MFCSVYAAEGTLKEEAPLLDLWKKGITEFNILGKELNRKPLGVKRKLERMGVVVGQQKIQRTTTAIKSKDLLTPEEALKILAGALDVLREPGLDKLEITWLRALIEAAKT